MVVLERGDLQSVVIACLAGLKHAVGARQQALKKTIMWFDRLPVFSLARGNCPTGFADL